MKMPLTVSKDKTSCKSKSIFTEKCSITKTNKIASCSKWLLCFWQHLEAVV